METTLVKQNINCLENPLWVLSNHQQKELVIENERGLYVLKSLYKLPERVDICILLYILLNSQKQNFKKTINLTRHEILKSCNMNRSDKSYKRLEEALETWKHTGIKFKGTFYDDRKYYVRSFGIINEYKIDELTKELYIELNKSFLEMMQHNNFCKYINFDEYKQLKRPLSARLYELLIKSFYNSNEWQIEAFKLAEKLTLGVLGTCKLYPSHIKTKISSAIKDINQYTELQIDLNTHKNKNEETIFTFKALKNIKTDMALYENQNIEELLKFIKPKYQESETIKKELQRYYKKYGFDYVKYNIIYTNQKAANAYISYLKQALKENWGENLRLQTELKQQAQIKAELEQKAKLKKEKEEIDSKITKEKELDNLFKSLPLKQQDFIIQEARILLKKESPLLDEMITKNGLTVGLSATLNDYRNKILLRDFF